MPNSSYEVTYPDNKTLNAKFQMDGLLGGPEGAMNIDDLMGKMYMWKMRALQDARNLAPVAPKAPPVMGAAPRVPYTPERMPLRDLMQTNSALNRDLYSGNGTRINRDWMTMPFAASATGTATPESGWDWYAKMAAASAQPNAAAQTAAGAMGRQQQQQEDVRRRF